MFYAYYIMGRNHRYTREITDLLYHLCKSVVSHGAQIGGLRVFAGHTCKNKRNTICPQYLRSVWHFTRVHLHTKTAVDAGGIRTWRTMVILIMGNTRRPPIWAPCRNKDGIGSGISLVYLWKERRYKMTSSWQVQTLHIQALLPVCDNSQIG